jgi:hypothetical protein
MHALDETDRAAVLLRYFENKTLREVGATLGTSEDAAQKRISRAVERLREFFAKRGVTIGSSGLVVVISANAVQAAPAGLALTISAAATLAGATLATTAATKIIAMTTLQKSLITATLITGVATTFVMQHQGQVKLRDENQSLRKQLEQSALLTAENERQSRLAAEAGNPQALQNEQFHELLRLRSEVGVLRAALMSRGVNPTFSDRRTNAAVGTKQSEDDQISNVTICLKGMSADQVLSIYADLTNDEIEVTEPVKKLRTQIYHKNGQEVTVTRAEAIRILDQELRNQAGVEITHPETNHAVAILRR